MAGVTPDRTPDWLGLADAERLHLESTRDMHWKVHLGLWALLVFVLQAAYRTDVMQPLDCWACWFLQGLIAIDLVWNAIVQHSLEVSRARWREYQGHAAGQGQEVIVSVLRLRYLVGVLLPSGVTALLAMAACYVLSSPPIRGI